MAILGTAVGQKLQSLHVIERGSIPSVLIPFQFSRNKFLLPKYTAYLKKKNYQNLKTSVELKT